VIFSSSQNAKERRRKRVRGIRRSLENSNAKMNIVKLGNNQYLFDRKLESSSEIKKKTA
jgi:hypothetical protein